MNRLAVYLVIALAGVAVLWPLVRTPPVDSFPLSTFPMFAQSRPSEIDIDHVVATDAAGTRRVVPPGLLGQSEVLQAKALVAGAVSRGRAASRSLCREVAERLAAEPAWSSSVRVEVRSDRYRVIEYFDGARDPIASRVHARCALPRAE
jgi:hypothetical protein